MRISSDRSACGNVGRVFVLLFVTALLSGCAFRADLTLYQGERWEFISSIELTPQEDNGIVGASVRTTVAEWEYEQRPESVTINSERQETTNSVRYLLKAKGTGYDLLQHELVSMGWSGEVVSEPDKTVTLVLPAPWDIYSLVRNDFYLHVGKIIDTNAPRVEGNTAIWTSADVSVRGMTQMTAVVKSRSRLSLGLIGAGVIIVLIIGVVVALSKLRRPKPTEFDSGW